MTPEHIKALEQLAGALADFLGSGWTSEGSANDDDPHAGMDPGDMPYESVNRGGEIHNAVCAVQSFYARGKLPAPEGRNPWRELLRVCRHETDPFKRQNEAHHYARDLKGWAEAQLGQSTAGGKQPFEPRTRKPRGRPKASYEKIQTDNEVAAAWKQAYENGAYKPVWAKENGTVVEELDRLLNRVAKRKGRADKSRGKRRAFVRQKNI